MPPKTEVVIEENPSDNAYLCGSGVVFYRRNDMFTNIRIIWKFSKCRDGEICYRIKKCKFCLKM